MFPVQVAAITEHTVAPGLNQSWFYLKKYFTVLSVLQVCESRISKLCSFQSSLLQPSPGQDKLKSRTVVRLESAPKLGAFVIKWYQMEIASLPAPLCLIKMCWVGGAAETQLQT